MPVVFDHVAVAAHRIAGATDFLVGKLGGVSGFGGPSGPYRWWHWDFADGGRIEVLEPDGPPGGFLHRFLDRRGPGIHHVTFKVPSLQATCDRAESLGYRVVGFDDSNPHWREAFLHPRQAMGIVVQFAESDSDDSAEKRLAENPPPEPLSAPSPVAVVGLRMGSADRSAALRQWAELIEGEVEEKVGELLFRWPGSAMRIAVTLEAGIEDEAEAIELRADRALGLSKKPHPVLGTRFRQLRD
ncbi:MAG: VOC family protein [Myxococcota bacterium]